MVVVVDGAGFVRAGRLHRLLRRALVVGGLVAAGWLLSLLFASTAAAADEPADETNAAIEHPAEEAAAATAAQGEFAAMVSGVSGTVTHTVDQLTENVSATTATVAARSTEVTGKAASPAPTPASGRAATTSHTAQLARPAPPTAERAAPPQVPQVPPATPALSTSAAVAPEHPPRAAAVETPHDRTVTEHDRAHAKEHGPARPVESPAPVAPGCTAVSSAHDNTGGARSALGAPVESTPAPPPSAGFTSRGLAGDATGRVAGLPATSPD